jgi:parallel beta-helix repeat protein
MRTYFVSILLFVVYSSLLQAHTIHVPGDSLTIQGGIHGAVDGDTVMIDPGSYAEHGIDFFGKAITVMSTDPSDPGVVASTIVDADSMGRAFYFGNGERESSVLTGLTITGGFALEGSGGGIYCDNSSPTLSNNTITENSAGWSGGGIGCYGNSSPTVSNNTISKNRATDSGGGIWSGNNSSPIVSGNTITENNAGNLGGGIYCFVSSPRIEHNTITLNSAPDGHGGGIACWVSITTIDENTISGNTAIEGGGIHCGWSSNPIITNNTISENTASDVGGGIYCRDFASPRIENNLITSNSAANHGGGVYSFHYSSPEMINNTISGNAAIRGGGIFFTDHANSSITNTILWFNDAQEGPEIYLGSTAIPTELSIDYSDVEGGLASVFVDSGCTIQWGYSMMESDPLFRDAASGDYHLMALECGFGDDSPCIDGGDFAISDLTLDCSHGLGLIRSDMGAYGGRGGGPVETDEDKGVSGNLSFPKTVDLSQNFPNPFNPSTTISFTIPGTTSERQPVDLIIYDIRGRRVRTLIDSDLEPGIHTITWNGRDEPGGVVSSGMYLYTLKTRKEIVTRKMMVLK